MHYLCCLILALGLWVPGVAESGTLYKWTDENGKVHYSNNLAKVPRSQRPKAKTSTEALKKNFKGASATSGYHIPPLKKLDDEQIYKQLLAGENWDTIFPIPTPLPQHCYEMDFERSQNVDPAKAKECRRLKKMQEAYDKTKSDRIFEYQKWIMGQADKQKELRDAAEARQKKEMEAYEQGR